MKLSRLWGPRDLSKIQMLRNLLALWIKTMTRRLRSLNCLKFSRKFLTPFDKQHKYIIKYVFHCFVYDFYMREAGV